MGKAFNAEIPLKQRNEWGGFLREESEKVRRLTAKIKQAEHEVDAIIDKLFDLTLARSRFSKVRLPGNIDCHVNGWRLSFDCHVNGWRLSFPQNSGTLSMGARPSKPPREDARLNPRTRSGARHDALFTEVQRRRRKLTSKEVTKAQGRLSLAFENLLRGQCVATKLNGDLLYQFGGHFPRLQRDFLY
jgi:hypothetical protein